MVLFMTSSRAILCQGPLSHTCAEFWYMTWEQQSPLIIMLTTVVERGRVKCHKYWPDLDRYNACVLISYTSISWGGGGAVNWAVDPVPKGKN